MHNYCEVSSTQRSLNDVFKKARHHSRCISVLKFFLPFSALVIVMIFCWFTLFAVPTVFDPVILSNENEEDAMIKLAVLNPKLEGYNNFHEPYLLKAEKIFQDSSKSGIIEMQNVTAEASVGKQERVFLDAQVALYDNVKGHLLLDKPFTITTNNGAVAQFLAADINLLESQLSTSKHVNIQHAGLHLTANALRIQEKRQIMCFHGDVHLVINKQ
ncbi:LPS export ABC transporter periplasmic protein LptC [Bartonella sp. B41]